MESESTALRGEASRGPRGLLVLLHQAAGGEGGSGGEADPPRGGRPGGARRSMDGRRLELTAVPESPTFHCIGNGAV